MELLKTRIPLNLLFVVIIGRSSCNSAYINLVGKTLGSGKNFITSRILSSSPSPSSLVKGSKRAQYFIQNSSSSDVSIKNSTKDNTIVSRKIRLVDWSFHPLQHYKANTNIMSVEENIIRNRKLRAEELSNGLLFDKDDILANRIIYKDEYIIVVNKPSGVLCVPGVRAKEDSNLASLIFRTFGNDSNRVDRMIVHRLDMHTSGLVLFARTDDVQKTLHSLFRNKGDTIKKTYEALLCGGLTSYDGEIDLPLHRDVRYPPFMRVATKESIDDVDDFMQTSLDHEGWKKKIKKAPKESLTTFEVIGREYYGGEMCT